MAVTPSEPSSRMVVVFAAGKHGPPVPGVVVEWRFAPVHNLDGSPWQALVVTVPIDDLLVMRWVESHRLVELTDSSPLP